MADTNQKYINSQLEKVSLFSPYGVAIKLQNEHGKTNYINIDTEALQEVARALRTMARRKDQIESTFRGELNNGNQI